ncbi:hypothetical protein DNTS_005453, partial [Danionella cerebrum]
MLSGGCGVSGKEELLETGVEQEDSEGEDLDLGSSDVNISSQRETLSGTDSRFSYNNEKNPVKKATDVFPDAIGFIKNILDRSREWPERFLPGHHQSNSVGVTRRQRVKVASGETPPSLLPGWDTKGSFALIMLLLCSVPWLRYSATLPAVFSQDARSVCSIPGSLSNSAMPRRTTPLQDAINHILTERDKNSMLEIKHINPVKGRGIFALADFSQGEFVVEYRGELIDAAEAENRRKLYENACLFFMFDFTWKQKTWCIDGTIEDGSFGRLVNDEHKGPNCRMKLIEAEGKPHLCLFALKKIMAGTEITYDYGGKEWPWRKEIPLTVTSTAAQEPIKDCFQDQVITSTESTEESRIQSCNITSSSPASKLSGASLPSGQLSELGDKDPDLDPNVLATDLLRGTELRAERQSSSSTLDGPEHEVHCGRGQCAALPAKEGFEEVGIQSQEVFPAVFSTDITS